MVRFKNRYFVMEVFLDPNKDLRKGVPFTLNQSNIVKTIKDSILLNFGECGLGACDGSFQVKYVNPTTNICVIRSSREDYQKIWAAITMIRSIENCPVIFNLLDLSGNIRACRNAALKCDQARFEQYKLEAGSNIPPDIIQRCENCFEKIMTLES